MVEMTETARILNTATARSLVILDEIGRGTSTYDGISLAWAVVEQLHERVGARTLFATHYHELTTLAETLERVRNRNVAIREWNDEVVFLHRIISGAADRSYGIYVARLAGVPKEVVERAEAILTQLEADHQHILENSGLWDQDERGGRGTISGNGTPGNGTHENGTFRCGEGETNGLGANGENGVESVGDGGNGENDASHQTESGVRISQRSIPSGLGRRAFQLTFFELDEDPILEELDGTDLNTLSPMEALNLLNRWKASRPKRERRRTKR